MKSNTKLDFAGIQALKDKHKEQLNKFIEWDKKREWINFHTAHYDWWMFPVNEPSSFGTRWTVYEYEISELKKDENYIKDYILGVELLARSWGWDLYKADFIENPAKDQTWHDWPIRLKKCTHSLQLFGFTEEMKSMAKYADYLISKGYDFTFRGHDLLGFFRKVKGEG